jgi:endogenous inhibitor of DNA gyrase (YacG/DUF329 family)
MTQPVERVQVGCPRCDTVYEDWTRGSINLDLDDFDEAYMREATTGTCPMCGHVVELNTLVVAGGVWMAPG